MPGVQNVAVEKGEMSGSDRRQPQFLKPALSIQHENPTKFKAFLRRVRVGTLG